MPALDPQDRATADRVIAPIAAAHVTTLEGEKVQLRTMWADQPAMTCFLRHFGCLFCHQMVHDAVEAVPAVIGLGAQCVLVGNGTIEQARAFFRGKGLPAYGCKVVTDFERESYKAADMKRGYARTFIAAGARKAYAGARAEGHRIKGLFGDLTQLGGVLVTRPPLGLVYLHRSEFAGDHPDMEQVLGAVREATRSGL